MKIVADSHIPFVKEYFGTYGDLILKSGRTISRHDLMDADIVLVRSVTPVDRNLLANTKVKFVGSVTAGADHLDTTWLDQAGILWTVAAGFNSPPVADYVVSVVGALQKKHLLAEEKLRAAVIGVGNVGRLVVERFSALNMERVLCDPVRAQQEAGFVSTPLNELVDLDLITLHVPLTKTGGFPTYQFINKAFLQRQKPGCILLNASRGQVINFNELQSFGRHLHWCFDVWEHEPQIDKAILQQSLIATPHIAGYSVQSKIRGIDMIYQIACEQGIIEAQPISPIVVPHQQLTFTDGPHRWQDIVLGVFNPTIITSMMRAILLPDEKHSVLFDEMRNEFNYRHEFSSTRIQEACVSAPDRLLLEKLGLRFTCVGSGPSPGGNGR